MTQVQIQAYFGEHTDRLTSFASGFANAARIARERCGSIGEISLVIGVSASLQACVQEGLLHMNDALSVRLCDSVSDEQAFHKMLFLEDSEMTVIARPELLPSPDFLSGLLSYPHAPYIVSARILPVKAPDACLIAPTELFRTSDLKDIFAPEVPYEIHPACTAFFATRLRFSQDHALLESPPFDALSLPEGDVKASSVDRFFENIERTVSPGSSLHAAARFYLAEMDARQEDTRTPFLTVITRTQGTRPRLLREVLLCLSAQSVTDFEVLIMGHRMGDYAISDTERLIAELPPSMRERVRFLPVDRIGRSSPLNDGIEAARGRYIAVLDDDDLIFDHWVESFLKLSQTTQGRILHAYSVGQDWKATDLSEPSRIKEWVQWTLQNRNKHHFTTTWKRPLPEKIEPVDEMSFDTVFCRPFDPIRQMRQNLCPLCALAFPRYLFERWGMRFDESLSTTEDWAFLMQAAFLSGVSDIPEITFLYRRWQNVENSNALHDYEEWKRNYRYVTDSMRHWPLALSVDSLAELLPPSPYDPPENPEAELYVDVGQGFSVSALWQRDNSFESREFGYCFRSNGDKPHPVRAIRFDPRHFGFLTMECFRMRLIDRDGKETDVSLSELRPNGLVLPDRMVFLHNDPQVILRLKQPLEICAVLLDYKPLAYVREEDIEAYFDAARRHRVPGGRKVFFRRVLDKLQKK